jgi:hypothetical protein
VNILDENVVEPQQYILRKKHVRFRLIGEEIGRRGMEDDQIIPLLHKLKQRTFFTFDEDFYDRRLCHKGYCLVHLDIEEDLAADYVCRLLGHPSLKSKAKRMGKVIRVKTTGLSIWRIREENELHLSWK